MSSNNSMEENSDQNRGQNALQRRANQLKRWNELCKEEKSSEEKKTSPTRVAFSSATLFLSSVAQNDFQECERILRSDPNLDVNATTGDGLSALHQMAIDDNLEMCRWLLRHDADVNCRDNEGWTPLHAAASCGHFEIVKLLLSREECDVFAINCDGELARDVCDGDDCLRLIDDRMRRHLNITIPSDDDEDDGIPEPILTEIRNKELKQIENDFKEFLMKNRILSEKAVKDWLESTRDPTSGATVIHVCAAKGYNEILVSILETIHDKVVLDSLLDFDGFSALHSSAFWRQMTTFETLLKFGANYELKTKDSRLVADLCHENPKILELISETKKSRELAEKQREDEKTTTTTTTAETQRKLNAKRQRETRRPTQGVTKEDIEMALKTTTSATIEEAPPLVVSPPEEPSTPPPMPSSPPPIAVVSLSTPPSVNCISTTVSVPLYPQRRRQKRRSTGIDSSEVATTGDDTPEANDCVDSSQKPILSTTSSTPQTTPSETWRSRSSSRSSFGQTTDEEREEENQKRRQETTKRETEKSEELDYKKLYNELLKENSFLIRKIKEIELNSSKSSVLLDKELIQELQKEKQKLLRRISELEEELKQKEDLIKENVRLKDENSALIRVISKLSK